MKSSNQSPKQGLDVVHAFVTNLSNALWKTFVSVRLTITLLILLIGFSIVGTMVAQQGMTQVPIEQLYKPEVLKWLVRFGLIDIFHSAAFIGLLLTLAINLITCSIERLPKVWHAAFHVPPPPVSDPTLKEWTPEIARIRKYLVQKPGHAQMSSVREARAAAELFFQKTFGKYKILRDEEDQFQITVEKGKYSRLGVYITHLSLLVIMFGGVLGALVGFEGGMSVEEGTRQSWMQHIKGSDGGLKLMRENGMPVKGFLNLGFEVECENFTLETYDGSRPKLFKSVLNFYENDVLVHRAEIAVNHPTDYKGITFYQASYAETGVGGVTLKVFRTAKDVGREPSQVSAPKMMPTTGGIVAPPTLLPKGMEQPKIESVELVENVRPGDLYRVDGNAAFRVLQIEQNMMDLGPAVKVQYFATRETKKPQEFWVFKNLPGFDFAHRKGAPLNFVLEGIQPKYSTGLSIAKDPGVWVVWIGCSILILALFLALYTCHSRYWVAYTKESGFVVVGWSNKLFLFDPRFEKFYSAFKKEFKI